MELDGLSRVMTDVTSRLDQAGHRLGSTHAPALGGESTGQLGALGRDLAALFANAASARAAEAAAAALRAADLADGVGRAVAEYRDVESARGRRS